LENDMKKKTFSLTSWFSATWIYLCDRLVLQKK